LGGRTNPGSGGAGAGLQVACNGSNINPYTMRLLQMRSAAGGYYLPSSGLSPSATSAGTIPATYSIPAYDREYQGMLNFDYIVSPKHTISSRYFHQKEPQEVTFLGNLGLPG